MNRVFFPDQWLIYIYKACNKWYGCYVFTKSAWLFKVKRSVFQALTLLPNAWLNDKILIDLYSKGYDLKIFCLLYCSILSTFHIFQIGAERSPATVNVGGDAPFYPRRRVVRHSQLWLPRFRYKHRPAVCGQREPGHQRDHINVLILFLFVTCCVPNSVRDKRDMVFYPKF